MLIIGLTGPTGAGKGTVASRFAVYGVPSIDTDAVYHQLLIPPSACLDAVAERFGASVLKPDGSLDRSALASRVFAPGHEEERSDLNHITHAYILDCVRATCRELDTRGVPAVLVDAPLLYESGFDAECDRVLAVLADPDVRLARIMARDGLPLSAAVSRLRAQKPDSFYTERASAVIRNDGSPEELDAPIRSLLYAWKVVTP